VSVC